ncbi:MAG: hypothetical protein ACRD0K_27830 [Egibacteraceae bacterium]
MQVVGSILIVLVLLGACGSSGSPVLGATEPRTALDQDTPITLRGIGPVAVGMTVREAEEAAGIPLIVDSFEDFGRACYFARPEGLDDHVYFLILAPGEEPVADPRDGIVSAVGSAVGMASPAQTDSSVGIGSTEAEVYAAYSGQVQTQPHRYDPKGRYLTFVPSGPADQANRIRFSTDGTEVVGIDAGLERATSLVEGCAQV